ncbi:hypothetical protein [Nocardioides sp. InS609-2]|uniref:hypothetical protein n=1 Tax=Nocardioides sp. InS609-2 TaxID=2760705 RepID=UPI0020C0A0A3|nr:hypothetical protein [Nocardioides sp. InS609-2]
MTLPDGRVARAVAWGVDAGPCGQQRRGPGHGTTRLATPAAYWLDVLTTLAAHAGPRK